MIRSRYCGLTPAAMGCNPGPRRVRTECLLNARGGGLVRLRQGQTTQSFRRDVPGGSFPAQGEMAGGGSASARCVALATAQSRCSASLAWAGIPAVLFRQSTMYLLFKYRLFSPGSSMRMNLKSALKNPGANTPPSTPARRMRFEVCGGRSQTCRALCAEALLRNRHGKTTRPATRALA